MKNQTSHSTTISMLLRSLLLLAAFGAISGCMSSRENISGQAWNQTANRELQAHEDLNQTSIFGRD